MFQKCEQFSYEGFGILGGPKWSPTSTPTPTPHPWRQRQSSLPAETFEEKNICLKMFYVFYEKQMKKQMKNGTESITSCSIRRVVRRGSIPRRKFDCKFDR